MTDDLGAIERAAVELAQTAGRAITASLNRVLDVRYKTLSEDPAARFKDPVSEIDQAVEALVRQRLAERFPDHGIIGEEVEERPAAGSNFVWVIDPVDGTANFVNGFPLFSASIGVVFQGRPVVGAVWCSTSHALRAGVYHAREGGALFFDGDRIPQVDRSMVKQRIVGLPRTGAGAPLGYDGRHTGSAAIECAFVAAGLLSGARFAAPNIWDVAGGIPLVAAAGGNILNRPDSAQAWTSFERFDAAGGQALWRQPLIVGEAAAAAALSVD